MILDDDLIESQLRLLAVDNSVVLPSETDLQLIITSNDVIHSFAIPALGIKIDAVPGVVNETWTKVDSKGVYYGQCSEICGIKHGFMPIALEVVSKEEFAIWVQNAKEKLVSSEGVRIQSARLLAGAYAN